ncbi:hypothetical protein ACLB2K_013515 [Fragaria x ananassa]
MIYIYIQARLEADVRTSVKVRTSLRSPLDSADDGAPPPQQTPTASPTTFPPRQVRRIPVFRQDHPKLQTRSISPENWNSADSPGRESDRERCWSPLGWRRAVIGARPWRTEGREHFKDSAHTPAQINSNGTNRQLFLLVPNKSFSGAGPSSSITLAFNLMPMASRMPMVSEDGRRAADRAVQERTSALGLKCGRLSVLHRRARLHPSGLQQHPRPLSLPGESAEFQFSGEITQNFKSNRSRRKNGIWQTRRGKVIRNAAGVRWGGGVLSGGERRDVRILSRVRTAAPEQARIYIRSSKEDVRTSLKVRTSLRSPPDGSDDGAPPPKQTPAASPITFSSRRDRFEGLGSNLHPKLQTRSISPENWNSADSPGRESDRGRRWCPLGWRVRRRQCRTVENGETSAL